MLTSRFPVRISRRLTVTAGSLSLAIATSLVLLAGAVEDARAEKGCPPACVSCRAKGGAWVNNFCFLPIKPDVNTIEVEEVEDPVLVL